MKIPYFCCIGAELKRYEKDFDFMNQVYLYKIPTDDTLEEVLAQDYFLAVADTVLQDDLLYIYEPTAQVLHTCRFNKQAGHITAVQLANNVPGLTPNRVLISDSTGHIVAGDVTLEYLKNKLNLDGTNTMTGPLKMRSSVSFKCAIAPSWDGVGFYKLNDNDSLTLLASMEATDGLTPAQNNTYNIGTTSRRWKDAYIGRVITAVINNGFDIAVPVTNSPDTLALKSEVDNAANSGRMITDEGVWFAKMYAASVVPTGAEYDGKNYADFSQTDGDGNPVIKIYTGASGAWTLTDTITPPATYDGYVPVTKKIWDILDQTGQQGGRILWSHQSKTFTPFPNMVSFEDAALTGTPTAPTPTESSPINQIATKEYVDNANPSGTYHPGILAHEWDDHLRNNVSWLRADTFSWQAASVYQAAYKALFDDIYEHTVWTAAGESDVRTNTYTPAVGDEVYLDSSPDTVVGTVTAFDELNSQITVSNGNTYTFSNNTFVTPVSETVAGYTLSVYVGHTGRKIVTATDETNVLNIYNATGVAWYYIIDITNKRFKLPRTKFAETGLRDTVGNYVDPGLPNITGNAYNTNGSAGSLYLNSKSGAFKSGSQNSAKYPAPSNNGDSNTSLGFDASLSNPIYGNSNTVQPPATQMYLYFYVGEFTQTALENTAGINAELFNDKVDIGHDVIEYQAPTAENNYTWYRKYRDGWVEQGGTTSNFTNTAANSGESKVITLSVTMANSKYDVQATLFSDLSLGNGSVSGYANRVIKPKIDSTTQVTIEQWANSASTGTSCCAKWMVCGMAA